MVCYGPGRATRQQTPCRRIRSGTRVVGPGPTRQPASQKTAVPAYAGAGRDLQASSCTGQQCQRGQWQRLVRRAVPRLHVNAAPDRGGDRKQPRSRSGRRRPVVARERRPGRVSACWHVRATFRLPADEPGAGVGGGRFQRLESAHPLRRRANGTAAPAVTVQGRQQATLRLPRRRRAGIDWRDPRLQNLCWKVALVLAGDAAPALLDTYQAERRAVDQAMRSACWKAR
jgi:FAD binding domain